METDWIRKGECNECGECCRQATNCVDVLIPIQRVNEAYGRVRFGEPILPVVHGIRRQETEQTALLFRARGPVVMPCPKLDGDRCTIQDTKPQYCHEWPYQPDDVEALKCSYWFVNEKTGEIRGTPVVTH